MKKEYQIIAAPMAGITDQPYRRILSKITPGLAIETEMISCHSIVGSRRLPGAGIEGRNFDRYDDENIGAQIFGADAALMAEAAKILEGQGATWIDINSGCPVPKVAVRAQAGAHLMRDHKLAGGIMDAVRRAVKIPVSLKTRLGWDEKTINVADMIKLAKNCGMDWVTVHARTRAQGYSGDAQIRWHEIPQPGNIPIIFNGDIRNAKDLARVREMGADGAMIGRAMMGNPWVFQQLTGNSLQLTVNNKRDIILEHLELMLSYYGKQGLKMFRSHAAYYATGMPGVADFRGRANRISDETELKKIIKDFFNEK